MCKIPPLPTLTAYSCCCSSRYGIRTAASFTLTPALLQLIMNLSRKSPSGRTTRSKPSPRHCPIHEKKKMLVLLTNINGAGATIRVTTKTHVRRARERARARVLAFITSTKGQTTSRPHPSFPLSRFRKGARRLLRRSNIVKLPPKNIISTIVCLLKLTHLLSRRSLTPRLDLHPKL